MRYMKAIYVDIHDPKEQERILNAVDVYLLEIRVHAEDAMISGEVDYDQDWDLVKEEQE